MAQDLTTGKIAPQLVKFTIPLVLGNLFQLTYNAVDSIIVGTLCRKGSTGGSGYMQPYFHALHFIFKRALYGRKHSYGHPVWCKGLRKASQADQHHDDLRSACSLPDLSVFCILFAHPILSLMQVDPSIMSVTVNYMRIIFAGLLFTFMYNCFASTLRALGRQQIPAVFFDHQLHYQYSGRSFLCTVLKYGKRTAAPFPRYSAKPFPAFCVSDLYPKKVPILQLGRKWAVFDKSLLKKTVSYGWASAMQQATVQLGKLGIQAIVNSMGVSIARQPSQ